MTCLRVKIYRPPGHEAGTGKYNRIADSAVIVAQHYLSIALQVASFDRGPRDSLRLLVQFLHASGQ